MILERDDILVISNGFWDEPKRVRHKMPMAWAKAGNRVLWIEQPPFPPHDWRTGHRLRDAASGKLTEVAERLWVGSAPPALPRMHGGGRLGAMLRGVHRPFLVRRIKRYMKQLNFAPRELVLLQQPARWDLIAHLPHDVSIYYAHDLYGYGNATANEAREEALCCGQVDVVFTTAGHMRDRLAQFNPEAYDIPHAVDAAWWDAHCRDRAPEYDTIPRPRAVYTGVFTEKMDYELLLGLAALRPELQLVLVGPVTQMPAAVRRRIDALPNIHLLGRREVDALPAYIAGADVLLLPYVLDENRRVVGLALKFFEYLISGKPMIATPYTDFELAERDLFYVESDAEGWARRIDSVLQHPEEEARKAPAREALARRNDYAARVAQQRAILQRVLGVD